MKYIKLILTIYFVIFVPSFILLASNPENIYEEILEKEKTDPLFILGMQHLFEKSTEKDTQIAILLLEEAGESGNSIALYNLGYFYGLGIGVEANGIKALEYFKRSSEKGNSFATTMLAHMYINGEIVEKDYKKAAELYKIAVEKENSFAMSQLANLYLKGKGVEKNPQKAINLLQRAVVLKNTDGMNNLALLYLKGKVIKRDYGKAENLFHLAIEKENYVAQDNLIRFYDMHERYKQTTMIRLACGEMDDPLNYLTHVMRSEIIYIRTLAQLFKFRNQTFNHLKHIFDTPYQGIQKKKCMFTIWGEDIFKPFEDIFSHSLIFIPISENTYNVLECAHWEFGTKRSYGFPLKTSKDVDMCLYEIGEFHYMTLAKKNIFKCNNLLNMLDDPSSFEFRENERNYFKNIKKSFQELIEYYAFSKRKIFEEDERFDFYLRKNL